uniref:RNA methyltransferase n=2 Tax=Cacopsylla melanoneura TaxID=428564 RepID=A0A8D8S9Y7_9HEMI
MSSCAREEPRKDKFDENKSNKVNPKNKPSAMEEKDKHNNNKKNNSSKAHHKRKRCQVMLGNKCHKRRRIDYSRQFIPPTKFLLGGNIHDPLNLNSLQDEEINRAMNAVTPKSSPLPTPQHRKGGEIEVIIPPNICDPLSLAQCDDENTADYEAQLILPLKKMKKPKKKRKKSGCAWEETQLNEVSKNESIEAENEAKGSNASNTEISTPVAIEALPPVPTIEPAVPKEGAQVITPTEPASTGQGHTPKKVGRKESLNHSLELKIQNRRIMDAKDKIVSPVVPQPTHRVINSRFRQLTPQIAKGQKTPNFREKNCKFQYGNYYKYYGYRNPNQDMDPRIKILNKFKHVFHKKDVLDIGCNIGHITLTTARDFNANSVVGLDIDKHLIQVARTNIKHYVNCKNSPFSPLNDYEGNVDSKKPSPAPPPVLEQIEGSEFKKPSPAPLVVEQTEGSEFKKPLAAASNLSPSEHADVFFPISMPIVYGGIDIPGIPSKLSNQFPHNVSFVQGNYVLDSDILLNMEQAQFDVILCLSVTKWFHLNWGDSGLKRVFKRMYAQLREGGVLILEPQGWSSYKKKKNLTESIWRNYQSIEFFPHQFADYLLSEIGFTKCETLGAPAHTSKGFQRSIKLFTKGSKNDSKIGKDLHPSGEWT